MLEHRIQLMEPGHADPDLIEELAPRAVDGRRSQSSRYPSGRALKALPLAQLAAFAAFAGPLDLLRRTHPSRVAIPAMPIIPYLF